MFGCLGLSATIRHIRAQTRHHTVRYSVWSRMLSYVSVWCCDGQKVIKTGVIANRIPDLT
jgi:hypothetical protein